MSNLQYWIWLTTRKSVGAVAALRLLEYFITPHRIYCAEAAEYERVPDISPHVRRGLLDKSMDEVNRILADCDHLGVQLMTIQDADYPERLHQIDDPPPLLYIRGRRIRFDDEVAIGMVGARDATDYGNRIAGRLGFELARGGALVVSGIAQGIDSASIRGALKGGGTVVSVLAGGVDVPYPAINRYLYEDVAMAGALISEYPPRTKHIGEHFPQRNRIISGLSLGVIAVECKVHSGTMITVRRSLDQNRDVFAVPGNIDAPMSRGTNALIQQGAKLTTCAEDVLEEYRGIYPAKIPSIKATEDTAVQARRSDVQPAPKAKEQNSVPVQTEGGDAPREFIPAETQRERFTDDELAILMVIQNAICTADDIVDQTQIPARRVLSALTMLQVRGQLAEEMGRRFRALVELELT